MKILQFLLTALCSLILLSLNGQDNQPYTQKPVESNLDNSALNRWLAKPVQQSVLIDGMETPENWELFDAGALIFSDKIKHQGKYSAQISVPTISGIPNKTHGRPFGQATLTRKFNCEDWSNYNRISLWVYADMPGFNNGSMCMKIYTDGYEKEKLSIWTTVAMNYVLLKPMEWNHIVWEIPHLPRTKINKLELIYIQQGNEPGATDTVSLYFDQLELEKVVPDYYAGWDAAPGKISYSHTGYALGTEKTAISNSITATSFALIDFNSNKPMLVKPVEQKVLPLGKFQVLDFSEINTPGTYYLKVGDVQTKQFKISGNIWDSTLEKGINFFYAERCGDSIPNVHKLCHSDWRAIHNNDTIFINGGWHDAGDLSQGEINTSEAIYSMFSLAEKFKNDTPKISEKLIKEALFGLDWLQKTRFGDGYRVVWGTMDFWTDGKTGNIDDCYGVVTNKAYENFFGAAASAIAAKVLKDIDPVLAAKSKKIAEEDWRFAMEEKKSHSNLDLFSQGALASIELYKLTGQQNYAIAAADFAAKIIKCQQIEYPDWTKPMAGFFYTDTTKNTINNYFHRGHDQSPIVALVELCKTLPFHPNWMKWYYAITLNSEFKREGSQINKPYNMLPAGIYALETDSAQVKNGYPLSDRYFLRRWPVIGDARGNFGVLLSQTKGLSAAANLRKDFSLFNLCQTQLQWVVGKNPFSASTMYGEGYDYLPMYSAMSGEITGALPVGIMNVGDTDTPFWPSSNCWGFKEVWVHPVSRWLWILSDISVWPILEGIAPVGSSIQLININTKDTILINLNTLTGAFSKKICPGDYKILVDGMESEQTFMPNQKIAIDFNNYCFVNSTQKKEENGNIFIELKIQGKGVHQLSIRAENLKIDESPIDLNLKPGEIQYKTVKGQIKNAKAPWIITFTADKNPETITELRGNFVRLKTLNIP